MPLADWEWNYNGLTFGGSQVIGVLTVDGIDTPDIKTNEDEKTGAHGGFYFGQFYSMRHIIIQGDVFTTGTVETSINTLRTTFVARNNDMPLTYKLPGVNPRRIFCRPKRLNIPVDPLYGLGSVVWTVELIAADQAIYDDTTSAKLFDG